MQATTSHPEIGYANNVDIIKDKLRCHGIEDNLLGHALACHVWHQITQKGYCSGSSPASWGDKEIEAALKDFEANIAAIRNTVAQRA